MIFGNNGGYNICRCLYLQWVATPVNDMYADAVLTAILQAETIESTPSYFPMQAKMDRMHFKVSNN